MGAVVMLATLIGLIALIFGVVYLYDPEARRTSGSRPQPLSDE
jgi:hypothetical protein